MSGGVFGKGVPVNRVVLNPSRSFVLDQVQACRTSLKLVSPFAKARPLERFRETGCLPAAARQLITRAHDLDYVHGVLDYEGLRQWVETGARLRVADRSLHAKICLFDDAAALVTSANLTDGGWDRNREVGIFSTDPGMVRELVGFFDTLWGDLRADVTGAQVARWQVAVQEATKGVARVVVPPGLKDRGERVTADRTQRQGSRAEREQDRRYFLKFYGTSRNKEAAHHRPADMPEYLGGLTCSKAPRRPAAGDWMFVCWQVEGGLRRVGARGEVERAWRRGVDVAPQALRDRSENIDRWRYVIWLKNVEVLRGPLSQHVDLDDLLLDMGAEVFTRSWETEPEGGGDAARKIIRSSRCHPEMTERAATELDRRFRESAEALGVVRLQLGGRTWWDEVGAGEYRKEY